MVDGSKLEFKDWSNWAKWSNNAFLEQFIPDIVDVNFTNLGQKKYIFKGNKNINKATLKEKIINTLKKADGTPIEELENLFKGRVKSSNSKKFGEIFTEDIKNADDLIKAIEKSDNFEKIFEIAE